MGSLKLDEDIGLFGQTKMIREDIEGKSGAELGDWIRALQKDQPSASSRPCATRSTDLSLPVPGASFCEMDFLLCASGSRRRVRQCRLRSSMRPSSSCARILGF
jgi:hypothetical protein